MQTATEKLAIWTAKAEVAEAELARLEALFDAETPNRESGNTAEASRLYRLMRGVRRDLETARQYITEANAWLAKFPAK